MHAKTAGLKSIHATTRSMPPPGLLRPYLFLWSIQHLSTAYSYRSGLLSPELLCTPLVLLAGVTGSPVAGLLAHVATAAAKAWRQPFQFNRDAWVGLADAATVVVAVTYRLSARHGDSDEVVRAVGATVRPMFGVFYFGAGVWKLNTSHLLPETSCSAIFFISLLHEYAPPAVVALPGLVRAVTRVAGSLTFVVETTIGLLLLAPSPRLRRGGVLLGLLLHLGIALTPPPNNVSAFSAVASMRYFHAVPAGVAAVLHAARSRAAALGAGLAAVLAAVAAAKASGRLPRAFDDVHFAIFVTIALVVVCGLLVEARGGGDAPSGARVRRAGAARAAHWACVGTAWVYAFGLLMLGLQDMTNVHMFANLRVHGGSNHLLLPTGLLQRWADAPRQPSKLRISAALDGGARRAASSAAVDAGPFAGGVVRVDRTNSSFISGIYPLETTSFLAPGALELLASVGHSSRQFLPLVGRIYGPDGMAAKSADSPSPLSAAAPPSYTVPALELRRLLADARVRGETSFALTYARLPTSGSGANGQGRGVDWQHAASSGGAVTVTVDAHGRTSCAVDATQEPCAADEPALMPWPPDGPGWLVWLTLKLLVWYPVPLLPGSVEMACCDG